MEVVDHPGGVGRVLRYALPEGTVHVAAHPLDAVEPFELREVSVEVGLGPAGDHVEDGPVLEVGDHRHHPDPLEVLLVDAEERRHLEPESGRVLPDVVLEDVLHGDVGQGVLLRDLPESESQGALGDVGVGRLRHAVALVHAADRRPPDVPARRAPHPRELDGELRGHSQVRRGDRPRTPRPVAVHGASAFRADCRGRADVLEVEELEPASFADLRPASGEPAVTHPEQLLDVSRRAHNWPFAR